MRIKIWTSVDRPLVCFYFEQCDLFITILAVPTSVTQFQQFCEVIVWRPPLQVQGDLEGFSLQFRFTNGTVQTLSLESSLLFYTTTMDQRKAGVKTRVSYEALPIQRTDSYFNSS